MTVGSLVYSCVGRRRKRIPRCFTTPALPALPGLLSGNRPWAVWGRTGKSGRICEPQERVGKGRQFFPLPACLGPVSSLFFPLLRIALASVERWGRSLLFPFPNLLFLWGAFPALTSPAGLRCITTRYIALIDRQATYAESIQPSTQSGQCVALCMWVRGCYRPKLAHLPSLFSPH